ncbi:MAG: PAS domain S-box protein [Candidatus Aegiribacteria sp.]|nr:PAS domain S-box protein [Candidatus Aegiribacteria sp.]
MSNSDTVLSYVSIEKILQDSDEFVLFISRTGTIILINKRGSEILGRSEEDIAGSNWFNDFIPDSYRNQTVDEFRNSLCETDQSVFHQDYPVLSGQGTEKPVSWHNRIITDEDGIVMCILVTGHTIDEPKDYQDEFINMYRTLVENSNDPIIVHKNGIVVFVNSIAKSITGYLEDEFYGSNFLDFISTEYKPIEWKYMNDRTAGKNTPLFYDMEFLRKDGDIIPAEISVSAISYEGERAYMAILRDMSNRYTLEEQLRQAQKMEAVGQLAGGVAHDFNNILQTINGYTELARTSLDKDNPIQGMLQQVSEAGERASFLVKQLLTFSRNQLIVTRVLDLNEVIAEHQTMMQRIIGEDIVLEFLASSEAIYINGDHAMIGKILLNIFLNARDAMPEGGNILIKTKRVFLEEEFCKNNPSAEQGYYAMVSISDTGYGMDKEILTKIFEPFFSTKGITAGTGLGLSTVFGIVTQHDGIITASSEPGNGTSFRIYFPLVDKDAVIEELLPEQEVIIETSKTIVITEDDEKVRNLTSTILIEAGHDVITAANGEEAVLLISDSPDSVDLVILDVIMPILGGYEAADRIREIRPDMPLIFCSGYSKDFDNKNIHRDRERSTFLSKPYSTAQLLNAISELFSEKK